MKKYYLFLFSITLMGTGIAGAQKNNYLEALVITHRHDTIAYKIVKRNWKKQPREIRVKTGLKDSILVPSAIAGFIIPSLQLVYISKEISPAKFIDNIQNATNSNIPERDTAQVVFLKQIHRGTFNLYLYFDRLNRGHYFVEAPDNFLEIYSHYYSTFGGDHNSKPVAVLFKQFEFTLKVLMTPCRAVFTIIEKINLKEEHLRGLFEVYDKCLAAKKEEKN